MSAPENWISNKHEFFERIVVPIPGWLHRGAAIRIMDMLEYQEQCGVQGSLLEIGIYCGKYLSILIRHAGRSKTPVLRIDTFQLASPEKVIEHLGPVTSVTGTSARLMKVFSTDCDAITVLGQLNQRARFISIDGSHERDDVHWDRIGGTGYGSRRYCRRGQFLESTDVRGERGHPHLLFLASAVCPLGLHGKTSCSSRTGQ